jgi:hypothetical protein
MDEFDREIVEGYKEYRATGLNKRLTIPVCIQIKAMGMLSMLNHNDLDNHYDEIIEQVWYECSLLAIKLEMIKWTSQSKKSKR